MTLFALDAGQLIENGKAIGTASNQVLLGILLVLVLMVSGSLIGVVLFLYRRNERTQTAMHSENRSATERLHTDHRLATELLLAKMEERESAMTVERNKRIDMLMGQQREDIEVKKDVRHAIENNTGAIHDLKEFIRMQNEALRGFLSFKHT